MTDPHGTWCPEIDGSHCAAILGLLERVSALEAQVERWDNPPIVRTSDAAYGRAQWQAVTDSASRTQAIGDTPEGMLTDLIAGLQVAIDDYEPVMHGSAHAYLIGLRDRAIAMREVADDD